MKILMINGSYPPETCGVGDYTQRLCEALSGISGTEVSVLTSSYLKIRPSMKPVRVMPQVPSWGLAAVSHIKKQIQQADPDIVHLQFPNTQYKKNLSANVLPVLLRGSKYRIIETWHEPVIKFGLMGKLRSMFTMLFARGLIFVEKSNYDTLPFYVKAAAAAVKKEFINIGSNIPPVSISEKEKKAIRKKAGQQKGRRLMMTFGFITETKGFDKLLDAYDPKKYSWVHLGKVNENEMFQKNWKLKAEKMGLYRHIRFVPGLSSADVAKWLNAADLCVFPFTKGVSPRHGSFLAAASQSCYIVTTSLDRNGYDKKENIWYIRPDDLNELKKSMAYRAKNTKRSMVPKWEDIAKQHVEFYKKVLENK